MNFPHLKYPNKSHRKSVKLPRHSTLLAEFFGIMIGDGGINNHWQANISMNATKDLGYSFYIAELCHKLFDITPAIRERQTKNTLIVSLTSTTIVEYLIRNGLCRGNKLKAGLKIPTWILNKKSYQKACVKGLIDTDGCLFIHVHKSKWGKVYRNIGLNFSNYSPDLIFQVADILNDFGIIPHLHKSGKQIFVYQAEAVAKYLKEFGTSNNRIKLVYKTWRDARAV